MVNPGPVRSSGSMTWVRYSLMSTTLPRPKATLTQCLPAMCATRHRLLGELHAVGDGMHRRRLQQRLAPAPCPGRDVLSGLARKLGLAVGHRLDRHADIRHVGEGEAEEHVHIDVGLTRFPDQGALDQVYPR